MDTMLTPENCPFALTVRNYPGPRAQVIVSVPESSAPEFHRVDRCERCIAEECGEESTASHLYERDHGSATWPTDERIAAEASRQVGHLVRLVGCGDAAEQGEWVQQIEPVPCLGNAFAISGELRDALDGLTVRDAAGEEQTSYATCYLAVCADLDWTDNAGLLVEYSTGDAPWSRDRVRRLLAAMDPEERRELHAAASAPPCERLATCTRTVEDVEIALCAEHAAEIDGEVAADLCQCGTVREDGHHCAVQLGADRVTVAYVPAYQRSQVRSGVRREGVEEQIECDPACARQLVADAPSWARIVG